MPKGKELAIILLVVAALIIFLGGFPPQDYAKISSERIEHLSGLAMCTDSREECVANVQASLQEWQAIKPTLRGRALHAQVELCHHAVAKYLQKEAGVESVLKCFQKYGEMLRSYRNGKS